MKEEVLTELKAPHWDLRVWSTDVKPAQQRLAATMQSRGKAAPCQGLRVQPASGAAWHAQELSGEPPEARWGYPVFFENQNYEFEFRLSGCQDAYVRHRSQRVIDAFRYESGTLRGVLNFGNDIGWFSLELLIVGPDGGKHLYTVSIEVYPTKVDMATDLEEILEKIDATYPLWRFSYGRPTGQRMDRKRRSFGRFPLIWLEHFKALREELERHAKLVCNAPHHRLQETKRMLRLEQLRGKLPPRSEESIAETLRFQNETRRREISSQRLSLDTAENRFVRSVLEQCDRELMLFQEKLKATRQVSQSRISGDAVREIADWRREIRNRLAHRLWNEVGKFQGLQRESLVLQERAGYSGVYRVWLQLRMYLDVFGRHATISLKSVSELYEVWCFLEILRQLESLGFSPNQLTPPKMNYTGLEAELAADGMGAAFRMRRGSPATGDLLELRLAHEPLFGVRDRNKPGNRVVSWLNVQKPDIVIEATFPDGEKLFWIFDAKYRIQRQDDPQTETDEGDSSDEEVPSNGDMAPPDAINQMHRYRDAIVRAVADDRSYPRLSRPVIGAFCLFPGYYSDDVQREQDNPYRDAIEAVGIGAFSALPGQENVWLAKFLAKQLGLNVAAVPRSPGPEWQLAQWAPRIEPPGLQLRRERELVFIAHIGGGRTPAYIKALRDGTGGWFHVQDKAIARGEIAAAAMRDVTHCGIALPAGGGAGSHITHIYKVRSVRLVERTDITPLQAGAEKPSSNGWYWLFELGESETLRNPLRYEASESFRAWLTSPGILHTARAWRDISETANASNVELP